MIAKSMHQTTVRFSPELWADLAAEAEVLGVSVAQFIREAALARLAYSAGRRGDGGWEAALRVAGAALSQDVAGEPAGATQLRELKPVPSRSARQSQPAAKELRRRVWERPPTREGAAGE